MGVAFDIKAYRKAYYQAHRMDYARRNREWAAKNRKARVLQTLNSRSKNTQRFSNYQKGWRLKNRSWVRQWNENHTEANRQYRRKYYLANKHEVMLRAEKRRALKALAEVNLKSIKHFVRMVKSRKFAWCYYCSERFPTTVIHFDHIIPLSKGGPHSVENLCVSCQKCNWSKGSKLLTEWTRLGQQVLPV